MVAKKHIDDVQTATVDEHFQLILEDKSTIDTEPPDVTPDDLPEWFDEELFKRGQRYYMDNLLGSGIAQLAGLLAIISVPDIVKILDFTKQSSTVCLCYKRYTLTLLSTYVLFNSDATDPKSNWYKIVNIIRGKHSASSRRHVKSGFHAIYQKDMVITQFALLGFMFLSPEAFGLTHTPEERVAYNHFWRVMGRMLGISDRLNLCRKRDEETIELCRRIRNEIIANHMKNPVPEFTEMTMKMLNGLWYQDFTIDADAFLALTYRLTGLEYSKTLGWYSHLNFLYRDCILYLCGLPYLGIIIRTYTNCVLRFAYWAIEYWSPTASIAFGKRNAKICLFDKRK